MSAMASPDAVPRSKPATAKILMVDDRASNLLALEAILQPLGSALVRANSGEEALRRLLDDDFALILMDVQMPGMDGFQCAKIIKERPRTKHIPIIFITAISRDLANVFHGYETGAVDYLMKPFEPEILRSKVSVFVDLFRLQEQIREQAALIQQKEREELQRRNEERFRTLTDSMPLSVVACRPDGVPFYCNRFWREYAGLVGKPGETIASPGLIHEDEREMVATSWAEAVRTRRAFETQYRIRRASDKAFRWHLARAVPELDDHRRVLGWISTLIDIHEQKLAADARGELLEREKRAREAAEAANRMKDEFLATVSHELRTPLTAILGWIRMIRTGMLDEAKIPRALETIERNAVAQTDLIEDILDVSRIITGKLRLKMRGIDMAAVTRAAMDTVRPAADSKSVSLDENIAEDLGKFVGDPDRLQQVIWNLLSNAIKFTPKDGRVTLRVARVSSHVEIEVQDTGSGIAPDFLPYVFDRFRQEDGASTRQHGGLGLGLAIVKHLVELHGGTIAARSEGPGKGATFLVRMPIRAIQIVEPAQPFVPRVAGSDPSDGPEAPNALSLEGLNVLFVDDQPDARELVSELFRHYGATVTAVADTGEAYRLFQAAPPDVLVSDIGLPDNDGYSLIRKVRELPAKRGGRVPAVAVTGFARAEDSKKALAEGFQVFLTKPVEPAELVSLVASLAGR